MCMYDAEGSWQSFEDKHRAARKEHRCGECGRPIRPGETYRYSKGIAEGEYFMDFKICAHCEAAGAWLMAACNGYIYTMILEDLREHWAESPTYRSPTLRALIDGMEGRWHDGADPVPDVAAIKASVPKIPVPA